MLSSSLAREIAELDDRQRAVVLESGNVAALAGPGAGKTRTLVAKVGYLLSDVVPARQGTAALTYTTKAADELTRRLRRLGLHPGRRLVSRTVHSFCFAEVLRPLATIADDPLPPDVVVIGDDDALVLLERCLIAHDLLAGKVEWFRSRVTTIRRRVAAGEDVSGFGDDWVAAVGDFEQRLRDRGAVDFESMTSRALHLLQTNQTAARLLAARFPQIVIDEYQDLGPVLHAIVNTLLKNGVTIAAVGDPDQTMYAFDGADPRYLRELAAREDFREVPLRFNYRSGHVIIAAGQGALGELRDYIPAASRRDPGVVVPVEVGKSLDAHASAAVAAVQELINDGVAAEDIAVLYPRRGDLLDALIREIEQDNLPVICERARPLPSGALADFVAACTSRRLTGPLPVGAPDTIVGDVPTVPDLAGHLHRMRCDAGLADRGQPLRPLGRRLISVLDASPRPTEQQPAAAFLDELCDTLTLDDLASCLADERDRTAISAIRSAAGNDMSLAELAGARVPGRTVVTTYHSAKGREFSAVVLPGLCEGLVPWYTWDSVTKRWRLNTSTLPGERRNFYVALTRARNTVIMIYGEGWGTGWRARQHGRSRFVNDVLERLNS